MKIENPNQKIEIKFSNQKIKSKNENQICATLFTYTYTYTLDWLSSWQEICCHQLLNCIIYRISNKVKWIYINIYTYNIIYIFSNICIYTYNIMHINSIISYANIMQLQISKHEQAHISHNEQQTAIQWTQLWPSNNQANQASTSPASCHAANSQPGHNAPCHTSAKISIYI